MDVNNRQKLIFTSVIFVHSLMKIIFLISTLLLGGIVSAQKMPLDIAAIEHWPLIGNESISNDGTYLLFNISNQKEGTKLIIQSIDNAWKLEIKGATNAMFTEDNQRVLFRSLNDSLGIVELQKRSFYLLDRIISYVVPKGGNGEWLGYRTKENEKQLVLVDLYKNQQKSYGHTESFLFSENGKRLILQRVFLNNNEEVDSLVYLDLSTGKLHNIWGGSKIYNMTVDKSGEQISFLAKGLSGGKADDQIWYYSVGNDSASVLVNCSAPGMQGMIVSHGNLSFSDDGKNLFFYIRPLREQLYSAADSNANSHLIIWDYLDDELARRPLAHRNLRNFLAGINLQFPQKVIRLENDETEGVDYVHHYFNNMALVLGNQRSAPGDFKWRRSSRRIIYLMSISDDTKKLVKKDLIDPEKATIGFSPKGSYVFWFDRVEKNWFTYEVSTGISRNITKGISFALSVNYVEEHMYPQSQGMAGWMADESALLIYDDYDIWQVDPRGEKLPINITHGYGRSHHLLLRYLDFKNEYCHRGAFSPGDTMLLYVFDVASKLNGFAKLITNRSGRLFDFSMHPLKYYYNDDRYTPGFEMDPYGKFALKARNASVFLFRPSRPDVYPNICMSRDCIQFRQLTDLEPEKQYNWYTNELVRWNRLDGTFNEGILFKPEYFDPKRKYPLIVYVYERFTDALNVFLKPSLTRGDLNIPWYVSHGYLVLVPDIHYSIGYPGHSAYVAVVSAIRYLSRFSWVDMKKLGLQGHSFGGYETNYIVTHTQLFAAAASAAGLSDLISGSGDLLQSTGFQSFYDISQMRIGATLWERPDLYIDNSPIFRANRVTSPLLIIHNTLDITVRLAQSIELFTSLRRLGKRAWMLQYTNEGHNIENVGNQLDCTVRLDQFFDHFLKDAPAPEWMKEENNRYSGISLKSLAK